MAGFYKLVAKMVPLIPKAFVKQFAAKYIAGETLEAAVAKVKQLNANGLSVTLDYLGEDPSQKSECLAAVNVYEQTLEQIHRQNLDSGISVKLSHMGLKLDRKFCRENIHRLAAFAHQRDIFVRIDMEDLTQKDDTLDIYFELHKKFPNTGCALQAYLRKASDDADLLIENNGNVRLCKGAYFFEDKVHVFKQMGNINKSYAALAEKLLKGGCFTAFATHDEKIVDAVYKIIRSLNAPANKIYEFQMLYGICDDLRTSILENGHPVRVYVPFGEKWLAYCLRRMQENPKIILDVLTATLK